MLKNRLFLMGVGVGIIVGALLFQLMLSGEQSRQRLNEMGNDPEEKLYTQIEVDALLKAEQDSLKLDQETKGDIEAEQVQPPAEESSSNKETSEAKTDETKSEVVPVAEQSSVKHVIRIKVGTRLSETADLLASKKVLNDEAAFISKMKKSKKLVRAGYFLFHEDITVDEAIAIVTGEPLTTDEVERLTASK